MRGELKTKTEWLVEVIEKSTGKVVKSLGPHESKKADRVASGILINLDKKKFYVTQKPTEVEVEK